MIVPPPMPSSFSNIEETGRRTMSELRQILGVLRETEDAERVTSGPVQSIVDIESLLDSANDLTVRLSTSGAIDTVPSGVATSAFRAVQEALTNASPARRTERDDRRPPGTNRRLSRRLRRGRRTGASADDKHVGYGLIGMSERVATFGGTLRRATTLRRLAGAGKLPVDSAPRPRRPLRARPLALARTRAMTTCDRGPPRRRPGDDPPGVADDPRRRAGTDDRRRGCRRRRGDRPRPGGQAGCRLDGCAHAELDGIAACEKICAARPAPRR